MLPVKIYFFHGFPDSSTVYLCSPDLPSKSLVFLKEKSSPNLVNDLTALCALTSSYPPLYLTLAHIHPPTATLNFVLPFLPAGDPPASGPSHWQLTLRPQRALQLTASLSWGICSNATFAVGQPAHLI